MQLVIFWFIFCFVIIISETFCLRVSFITQRFINQQQKQSFRFSVYVSYCVRFPQISFSMIQLAWRSPRKQGRRHHKTKGVMHPHLFQILVFLFYWPPPSYLPAPPPFSNLSVFILLTAPPHLPLHYPPPTFKFVVPPFCVSEHDRPKPSGFTQRS